MPQEESVLRLGRDEALEAARLWQECGDAREFACRVLGGVMNALMDSEAQQMCGAGRNERSEGRENSRNGYRPRSLKTAVGDVELEIPKLRHGTYYPEGMLARWSRVDTSVAAIVQEMYVCGVSTRKVERVASRLGISSLSSSEVSSLCSDLDAEVAEFRRRDLSGTPCCYLWLDATYMSCRVGSSVVSQGVVTAIGLGADGRKHFLGCDVVDTESEDSWAAFLGGLRERGLAGVRLVVSDSHAGLVAAVSRLFQGCAWQRCVTHLQRNLQSACSGRPEDSNKNRLRAVLLESCPALEAAVDLSDRRWLELLAGFGGAWGIARSGAEGPRAEAAGEAAAASTAPPPALVEAENRQVRFLAARISEALDEAGALEAETAALLEGDETYACLLTVPGIGPRTAAQLAVSVDIGRFPDHDHLASYCGIAPRVRSSGTSVRSVRASRRGDARLKSLLIFSCNSLVRSSGRYGEYYRACRARGMGHGRALKAVARKRLRAIYAVMRDRVPYRE